MVQILKSSNHMVFSRVLGLLSLKFSFKNFKGFEISLRNEEHSQV